MTRQQRLAQRLTRLVCGANRAVTAAAALCLTGTVALSGIGLAKAAKRLPTSEILARLSGAVVSSRAIDSARAASFLHYLNALAPAILNLNVQPEAPLRDFNALYDAARDWDVSLRDFTLDADGKSMQVTCSARSAAGAHRFYQQLKAAGQFPAVTFTSGENETNFTISCAFME